MHVRTLGTSVLRRSSPPVALLATAAFFGGTVVAMAAIAFASIMADAADEHEHLFGARRAARGPVFRGLGFR